MTREKNMTQENADEDDLSPEAVRRLWEEIQAKMRDDDPICEHCANLVWPARIGREFEVSRWRVRFPVCACHPDAPGVPREVHPCSTCPNFRLRTKAVEREEGEPPKRERPSDRFIPLSRKMWAIVDVRDFERLSRHRWYASPSGGGKMYARRNTKTGTILMHREILKTPKGMHVDHKDGNGLNNRPDNIRNCTPAQNQYNKKPRGKRSRFKGVYPHGDKWQAMIKHEGELYNLGLFEDDVEAAQARDRKAYELEGEFAYLNFPDAVHKTKAGRRRAGSRRRRPGRDQGSD
ncbi:MAG: HNH endonuclease [Solirubrobacterales bacterium]